MEIALESYCLTDQNNIRLLGLLRNMCCLFRIGGKKIFMNNAWDDFCDFRFFTKYVPWTVNMWLITDWNKYDRRLI